METRKCVRCQHYQPVLEFERFKSGRLKSTCESCIQRDNTPRKSHHVQLPVPSLAPHITPLKHRNSGPTRQFLKPVILDHPQGTVDFRKIPVPQLLNQECALSLRAGQTPGPHARAHQKIEDPYTPTPKPVSYPESSHFAVGNMYSSTDSVPSSVNPGRPTPSVISGNTGDLQAGSSPATKIESSRDRPPRTDFSEVFSPVPGAGTSASTSEPLRTDSLLGSAANAATKNSCNSSLPEDVLLPSIDSLANLDPRLGPLLSTLKDHGSFVLLYVPCKSHK